MLQLSIPIWCIYKPYYINQVLKKSRIIILPIISLTNPRGLVISNDNLPVGSAKGGNTFGGFLPYPFTFFSASYNGTNSKETKTYPYEIFYPSSSTASGW